jgi:hypothetical protein
MAIVLILYTGHSSSITRLSSARISVKKRKRTMYCISPCTYYNTSTIVVVGAGRGPMVDCCLSASKVTGIPIRVFAVEKNPQVHVT